MLPAFNRRRIARLAIPTGGITLTIELVWNKGVRDDWHMCSAARAIGGRDRRQVSEHDFETATVGGTKSQDETAIPPRSYACGHHLPPPYIQGVKFAQGEASRIGPMRDDSSLKICVQKHSCSAFLALTEDVQERAGLKFE